MDFKKSLKAFKFVDISKDLYEYAATFGANLKEKNLSEIEIYLSQSFDFCAAFFGALGVGVKPILLAKPIYSGDKFVINDENSGDCLDFSIKILHFFSRLQAQVELVKISKKALAR